MLVPKEMLIEKCTAKERGRYAMQHLRLEIETPGSEGKSGQGRLIATDGRCLAVVEILTHELDTTGQVPVTALVAARKGGKKDKDASMTAKDQVLVASKDGVLAVERPKDEDGEFPRWRAVVPAEDSAFIADFTVNAELLLKVQNALGADSVRLRIQNHTDGKERKCLSPILVSAPSRKFYVDGDGELVDLRRFGVVMPITSD